MKFYYCIAFIWCVGSLSLVSAANFPVAKIDLRVIDEEGAPIADATASVAFEQPSPDGFGVSQSGQSFQTNSDGLAHFEGGTINKHVTLGAGKVGYYKTQNIPYEFVSIANGTLVPDRPLVHVVLKRVVNPIGMYAKKANIEIPVVDAACGYDLVRSDWVAPYGRGEHRDLIFKLARRYVDRSDHEVTLEVSFPGPKDGLAPLEMPHFALRGSELRLPREAPADGYKPGLSTFVRRLPNKHAESAANHDMNYFLRVRSVTDDRGNIVSALYGKMHGDFLLSPMNSKTCKIEFTYYLNSNDNDRNVEWDPKRNLFNNLSGMDMPSSP